MMLGGARSGIIAWEFPRFSPNCQNASLLALPSTVLCYIYIIHYTLYNILYILYTIHIPWFSPICEPVCCLYPPQATFTILYTWQFVIICNLQSLVLINAGDDVYDSLQIAKPLVFILHCYSALQCIAPCQNLFHGFCLVISLIVSR